MPRLPIGRYELLENAELTIDGKPTYAGLILLGSQKGLSRHLAQAEVVFEYRSTEASIAYQQRQEYRLGFFLWFDDIWETINLRNDVQQFREGLFKYDIPTFDEDSVREAVLNAVSHRDYRDGGSIWIRQSPRLLEVESPGGFPEGITSDNVRERQKPRNRRIAEALAHCGLVERSGQGMDLMFRQSIRQGMLCPILSSLTLIASYCGCQARSAIPASYASWNRSATSNSIAFQPTTSS